MCIDKQQANQIVEPFGFSTTGTSPFDGGFFIAPVSKDRFGHRRLGDDAMLIRGNGEVVVYEHDAQAFLAATALSQAMRCAA